MRALIDSTAEWFWFLMLVVGVPILIVVLTIAGIRHEREVNRNKQRECLELSGLVVPSQDGWVCALPNYYKVEK